MNDIQSVSGDVLNSLSVNNQTDTEDNNELGKDAFLRLMIAQLQNQDPLNPAKGEDFIAQLAQFSSVEGINNINSAIEGLADSFRSSQALEASALVGRQVQVPSNQVSLAAGRAVRGTVELSARADNIQLKIENTFGENVETLDLGSQPAGDFDFGWDGTGPDGLALPDGNYVIKAIGVIDGKSAEIPVSVGANVNSVTVGPDNTMVLNVEGIGPVPLDSVRRFL